MHVFHIKGFSGLFMLLLAILAVVAVLLLLPAFFMMVLWNALVFEAMKGPQIDLYQGFLLWGAVLVLLKLIFKPQIQLQFQNAAAHKANGKSSTSQAVSETEEQPAAMEDAAPSATADQQH